MTGAPRTARRHGTVGGVVVEGRGQVLLLERRVLRRGAWLREVRLPKGRRPPGERDVAAALAEVRRLTGFDDIEVLSDLGRERVEYVHRGVVTHRQEHFFLMKLGSQVNRRSRAASDEKARLYEARFVPGFQQAAEQLSFPSEQGAVLRARAWWPRSLAE